MVNERIIKNYPSQATGILHAPEWKSRKWLAISSQIPINSIIKKIPRCGWINWTACKANEISARGNALGIRDVRLSPWKGKSFTKTPFFCPFFQPYRSKIFNLYGWINYAGRPVRPTRYQPRATPWESLMCNSRPERAKALPKHQSFALSFNRTGRKNFEELSSQAT